MFDQADNPRMTGALVDVLRSGDRDYVGLWDIEGAVSDHMGTTAAFEIRRGAEAIILECLQRHWAIVGDLVSGRFIRWDAADAQAATRKAMSLWSDSNGETQQGAFWLDLTREGRRRAGLDENSDHPDES